MQRCIFFLEQLGSLLKFNCLLICRFKLLFKLFTGIHHFRECLVDFVFLLL